MSKIPEKCLPSLLFRFFFFLGWRVLKVQSYRIVEGQFWPRKISLNPHEGRVINQSLNLSNRGWMLSCLPGLSGSQGAEPWVCPGETVARSILLDRYTRCLFCEILLISCRIVIKRCSLTHTFTGSGSTRIKCHWLWPTSIRNAAWNVNYCMLGTCRFKCLLAW